METEIGPLPAQTRITAGQSHPRPRPLKTEILSGRHADHGAVPSLMGPSTRAPVTGREEGDRSSQLEAKETGIGIRQESVRRPLHQTA
jgi:hypothetical protein